MLTNDFISYRNELAETLDTLEYSRLDDLFNLIVSAYENGQHIFILGNGGSAASASHWVCDFGKGINVTGKPRMKISALSDNLSILTAIANDFSYTNVFDYQLENLARSGDLVIALTVSGNSPNLISAFNWARSCNCHTAAIIGDYDGQISQLSDVTLTVRSKNYGIVEDVHMIINHIFSQRLKQMNNQ